MGGSPGSCPMPKCCCTSSEGRCRKPTKPRLLSALRRDLALQFPTVDQFSPISADFRIASAKSEAMFADSSCFAFCGSLQINQLDRKVFTAKVFAGVIGAAILGDGCMTPEFWRRNPDEIMG